MAAPCRSRSDRPTVRLSVCPLGPRGHRGGDETGTRARKGEERDTWGHASAWDPRSERPGPSSVPFGSVHDVTGRVVAGVPAAVEVTESRD